MTDPAAELAEVSRRLGWSLEPAQVDRLLEWLRAIQAANERVNLTAVTDFSEGVRRHLADSLAFGLHLREESTEAPAPVWVDLGTGGGFPGVVAAIARPAAAVHLVESRGRKLEAVRRAAEDLGIRNLRFHHARLGDLLRVRGGLRDGADLVFARGIGPLAEVVTEAAPALRTGSGVLLCWKSATVAEAERSLGRSKAGALGLLALPDIDYTSYKPCRLIRYRREDRRHGP